MAAWLPAHTGHQNPYLFLSVRLYRSTGYHVRVFTQYQMDKSKDGPNPRGIWGSLDNNTVVVIVSGTPGNAAG